jgi:S1-C subfamily serine protease
MGMTVTRGPKGRAEVSRVVVDGQAAIAGVMPGDCVIGIGGQWLDGFEAFMAVVPSGDGYPVTLVLRRRLPSDLVSTHNCQLNICKN